MEKKEVTRAEIIINILEKLCKEVSNKMNLIIKNQSYIKADTTQIGQMLQQYFQQHNAVINTNVPFVIKNMTEAQAKDLMRQGMLPEVVAVYADGKFSVQYLYALLRKGV